ncbi:hypothetical protein ACWD3C_45680, partial [Streptomyces sp. NPDC002845]
DVTAELAFLSRALKAPALLDAADRLAERATASRSSSLIRTRRCGSASCPGVGGTGSRTFCRLCPSRSAACT